LSGFDISRFDVNRLLKYFLEPKKTGYDATKTVTYGIILVVAVYGIYALLRKLKVRIDLRLALGVAPYVVLGSAVRVLEDMGMLNGYIFVTPGIYVFIAAITIAALLLCLLAEGKRRIPYFKPMFLFGLFLVPVPLSYVLMSAGNFYGALLAGALFLPWLAVFKFVKWAAKWPAENKAALLLQMFDATVTFVSLRFFGFYEQHVLPTAVIEMFGPASFIIVKLIAVYAMLLAIDKFSKDGEFNRYVKLVIGILGAATGTRDLLALMTLG